MLAPQVERELSVEERTMNAVKLLKVAALSVILASTGATAVLAQQATPVKLPAGVERVTAVEGITEYRLANGLRVLLFPDQTKQTLVVNVTYLVGSRNENYGETGMAHLLEHPCFQGFSKAYQYSSGAHRAWHAPEWVDVV
jgi:zinc protease